MTTKKTNDERQVNAEANQNEQELQEKLLMKCENTIFADEVAGALDAKGIASRQHDESQDATVGAYGAVTGIAIYVFEKDFEKARAVVEPIVKARNVEETQCKGCGSDEAKMVVQRKRYSTTISLVCLMMIVIPAIYVVLPVEFGLRSMVADIIAVIMAVIGFLTILVCRRRINKQQ